MIALPFRFQLPDPFAMAIERLLFVSLLLILIGCGPTGPKVYPISGTVTYEDGSIPQGEIVEVHFTPSSHVQKASPATGAIESNGKYKLSTFAAEDGAMAGEYKVTFNILQTYLGQESLVAPEYASFEQTPFTVTIKPSSRNFDFKVKKKM